MNNRLVKICAGIMLVIVALILNAVISMPAGGQLQAGHIVFIVGLALLVAGGIVLIVWGARQKKEDGHGEKENTPHE